jgi:hypothetical protein
VLYKDFRKQPDLKTAKENYETARKYFREFLTKKGISKADMDEANENIKDCDKTIQDITKAQAGGQG